MNGANPDPTPPAREPDDVARLKLAQALQRARYAIAWERVWPHLARLLTLTGLFLALSWAGLWLALPSLLRAFALLLFAAAAIAALIPLARFRWPTREDGLGRLDRGTGIRHRPATELADTIRTADPVALALWKMNVLQHISGVWIAIGVVVAIGLGVMMSVSAGKPAMTTKE